MTVINSVCGPLFGHAFTDESVDKPISNSMVYRVIEKLKTLSKLFRETYTQINQSLPFSASIRVVDPKEAFAKQIDLSALEWGRLMGTGFITSANILLSPKLDERQATFGIVVEVCNASFKEEFQNIQLRLEKGAFADPNEYADQIEAIEFKALKLARDILKDVDPSIISEVDQKISNQFSQYLEFVDKTGHREKYLSQFLNSSSYTAKFP